MIELAGTPADRSTAHGITTTRLTMGASVMAASERQRFEDDDERQEPREENRTAVAVWFAVAAVAVLILFVGIAGVGMFTWRSRASDAQQAARAEADARTQAEANLRALPAGDPDRRKQAEVKPAPISRDEFKAKVMGKTAEEVTTEIGAPDKTVDVGGRSDAKLWYYTARTFDSANKTTDNNVALTFEDGAVTKVEFVGRQ
jgi:hypothetical protein